jgi:hypothetical protein
LDAGAFLNPLLEMLTTHQEVSLIMILHWSFNETFIFPFWTTLATRILWLFSILVIIRKKVYSLFWFFTRGDGAEAEHIFLCNSNSGVCGTVASCVQCWILLEFTS